MMPGTCRRKQCLHRVLGGACLSLYLRPFGCPVTLVFWWVLERLTFCSFYSFPVLRVGATLFLPFYIFGNAFIYWLFKARDLSFLLHLGANRFWFSNELVLKAWLMSLQKLGDCGSLGASVVPRVGTVSESVAVCAWLPSPPDLAALECPRRPPRVPWRSVLVGILFSSGVSRQTDCWTQTCLKITSLSSGVDSLKPCCCRWLY